MADKVLVLLPLLLITHGACSSIRCSAIPNDESTDKLSLLDFKRAITKDTRRALRSWNASIPYCQWEGVMCSLRHLTRVTELNISDLGLAGTLSPSLGNLTFLKILDLTNNNFTGKLPPLNRLHRLQVLRLRNTPNSLQGMIPDTLANWSNLELLDLSSNLLVGEIPRNIGFLSNLFLVYLGDNMLEGVLPSNIGDMLPNLQWLELDYNKFEGHIPASLGNISGLQTLGLSFNNFIGQLP